MTHPPSTTPSETEGQASPEDAHIDSHRARSLEAQLKPWEELAKEFFQIVPGEHGDGVEAPGSPDWIRSCVKNLQEEWDGAEIRASKAETELSTAKAAIAGLEEKLKEESFRVEQYADALSSARIELGDGMGDLPFVCDGIRKLKIDAAEERTARLKAEADAAGMRATLSDLVEVQYRICIEESADDYDSVLRDAENALSSGTTGTELLSRLTALEAVAQRMSALFALDTPYPLTEVLRHLLSASQHLFREHSCDHHGYEEWLQAQDAGFVLMEAIRTVVMSHEYQALQKP